MKIQVKSFKEMKECGELPEPQLKTNSPEVQQYTRLKREKLTGECAKKESFVRGYRSQDGDYAQVSCNEDGTDCDVTFFASDDAEDPDEIIKDKHFDTIDDAETYLRDEGFFRESKNSKKESKVRVAQYGEFDNGHVLFDWTDMSMEDAENLAKDASLKDPNGMYYVAIDNVMDPSSDYRWINGQKYRYDQVEIRDGKPHVKESKKSKKESGMTINDYRVGEIVEWDGSEWTIEEIDYENDQVSLENFDGDNRVWVYADELDQDFDESVKKEASNGYDIISIKDGQGNPRYYIEGPDGDVKDDLGQVLYFSSREGAEDYVDTMLLN